MHPDKQQQNASDTSQQGLTVKEDRGPFVTIARTLNGFYFAAYMAWSEVSGSFAIQRTGHTRNKKKTKAINEGEAWARREDVSFRP